jgi:hypothetical protein
MGTRDSFWRYSARSVNLIAHLHLVPRSRMVELYLDPPICLHGVALITYKGSFIYGIVRSVTDTGRTMAESVCHRIRTASARVRYRVSLCGILGDKNGTRKDFLHARRFLLPIHVPPTVSHSLTTMSSHAEWSRY